ncbi:MAG: lytic murein transglycosylase, partial [Planctomycetota bacterium]
MAFGLSTAALISSMAAAGPLSIENSPRPQVRPQITTVSQEVPVVEVQASVAGFESWIEDFKARAQSQGISMALLDQSFQGVRYDKDVVRRDRNQSEFTKTIWDYLDSAASDARVRNGRKALEENRAVLAEIEGRYGVPAQIVAAIWGLESAYGAVRGDNNVIEALATLAYDGRRGSFFEEQLIAAFKILQNGDVTARNMTGSWAGAMGHTQFIPTSYLSFAVDFRGDGKRDIWSNDPTDALASTASYLKEAGWITGQPWGMEVTLPDGFDYALTGHPTKKSPPE